MDSYHLHHLEDCIKVCNDNPLCKWYTHEKTHDHCVLYEEDCAETQKCMTCATGKKYCSNGYLARTPSRECHLPIKCKADFMNSYRLHHLEDCIKVCNDNPHCKWYTHEKTHNHCVLYEADCAETQECMTCASGKKYCSNGYLPRTSLQGKSRRLFLLYANSYRDPTVQNWDKDEFHQGDSKWLYA